MTYTYIEYFITDQENPVENSLILSEHGCLATVARDDDPSFSKNIAKAYPSLTGKLYKNWLKICKNMRE